MVGGPQSGKSAALCTVVLGLALTSTPTELGVHVLDFGGGALSVVAGLPHVGTVADGQQADLVRRLVAELTAALARRERLFRASAVTSIAEFRTRRAAGDFCDEPATDLLLVVDGYLTLRGDFDDLEARLLPIAAKGLSYGLHLAVSANRWSELRPALRDLLGQRIELRLGDPLESEVDRRLAAAVPARPGHGLAADGSPMVLASPRTGDPGSTPSGLASAIAGAWPGPAFAPVRLLPDRVDLDQLPGSDVGREPGRLPIGVDERLERVDHDFAGEPHLLCFGDAECGKTALLRLLAHGHRYPLHPGSGPDRGRRLPPHAARRPSDSAPDRPHQHRSGHRGHDARRSRRRCAAGCRDRLCRLGRCVNAAGGPGPSCTCWSTTTTWSRPVGGAAHPLAPLLEFLAAGQGRRAAPGRRAALRWGRPSAVRPAARTPP